MKKLIFIIIPILLVGTVVGLGYKGIINIPGLTPAKKAIPKAKAASGKQKVNNPNTTNQSPPVALSPASSAPTPVAPKPIQSTVDQNAGAKKIAAIWGEMDPADIVKLIKNYKPKQVGLIFAKMDESQVAQVLELMPAKEAASLSQIIQKQVAISAGKKEASSASM